MAYIARLTRAANEGVNKYGLPDRRTICLECGVQEERRRIICLAGIARFYSCLFVTANRILIKIDFSSSDEVFRIIVPIFS